MIPENFYQKRNAIENAKGKTTLKDSEKRIIRMISGRFISRFLDVGCGDIKLSKSLIALSRIEEYYGLDISEAGVLEAQKLGIKAIKVDLDKENIPFKDNYFDFVLAGEIIEHLFDPDHLLSEAHRVITDNGLLLITTPNLASWHNRVALFLGYQPNYTEVSTKYNIGKISKTSVLDVSGHLRLFTLRALKELLGLHKFQIKTIIGYGTPMLADKFLFNYFPSLSTGLIVLCKKI